MIEATTFGDAVERVLAVGDQRWRQLVDLIAEMLPERDRWLPLLVGHLHAAAEIDEAQLARVRAHFDEDLGLLVTRELTRAHGILGGRVLGGPGAVPDARRREMLGGDAGGARSLGRPIRLRSAPTFEISAAGGLSRRCF